MRFDLAAIGLVLASNLVVASPIPDDDVITICTIICAYYTSDDSCGLTYDQWLEACPHSSHGGGEYGPIPRSVDEHVDTPSDIRALVLRNTAGYTSSNPHAEADKPCYVQCSQYAIGTSCGLSNDQWKTACSDQDRNGEGGGRTGKLRRDASPDVYTHTTTVCMLGCSEYNDYNSCGMNYGQWLNKCSGRGKRESESGNLPRAARPGSSKTLTSVKKPRDANPGTEEGTVDCSAYDPESGLTIQEWANLCGDGPPPKH